MVTVRNGRISRDPGGCTARVPAMPTGMIGTPQCNDRPRGSGVAFVQPLIGSPGPLGIDPQQISRVEDLGGGVESPLRCVPSSPMHGNLSGGPKEPCRAPVVEVLGFGHIGHPTAKHQRQEERVAKRLVICGQHGGAATGHVLTALDLDAPEQVEHRGQHHFEQPVGHGQRYRRL